MQETVEDPSDVEMSQELLPDEYDCLLPAEQLIHGEHNPRRVQPSATLRRSIQTHGVNRPLIVRPDEGTDRYHITDGWQRYQAATDCGWESLPVRVYESAVAALTATEVENIVRTFSTYEWAKFYQSLAIAVEAASRQARIETIADLTDKARSPYTIRKYLDVLELPEEVHPLLIDGPVGDPQSWQALQNHNPEVRQYRGLQWDVAAKLARNQCGLSRDRVLGIAAWAVEFDTKSGAQEFVTTATTHPDRPLGTIRKEVLFGEQYARYLEVPRTHVQLTREEKQAIMDYCANTRQSLTDLVTAEIKSLVDTVAVEESG